MKHNVHIIGTPEGEESEPGVESLFEVVTENFANLVKEKVTRVQEAQRPNHDEPKRDAPLVFPSSPWGKGHIHVEATSDRPSPSPPAP